MSYNECLHVSKLAFGASVEWCMSCGAVAVAGDWRAPSSAVAAVSRDATGAAYLAELERVSLQRDAWRAEVESRDEEIRLLRRDRELARVALRRAVGVVSDVQRLGDEVRAVLDAYARDV